MLQEVWQRISERLAAFEPEVAAEVIAKAQQTEVTRRGKDAFRELTGRWPTPLDEPYLQTARVLVEEGLISEYKEALEILGVPELAVSGEEATSPAPMQDQADPKADGDVALPESDPKGLSCGQTDLPKEEEAERPIPQKAQHPNEVRWQQAYRVVYGEDPSREPERYRERLEKALLLYDPAKGRRWAFEQIKAAEERLYASRKRAEEILSLANLVPPFGAGEDEVEDRRGDLYIHIGRLTAQVEELARRLDTLEGRLNREATRYGGLKSTLLNFRTQITALKEGLEALKTREQEVREGLTQLRNALSRPEGAKVNESALRTLKGEILAEVEERIQLATDLWRGEVEPRLKALEEWAKRITEAFRRTLDAKGRSKGLFGLFGGKE